MVPNEGLEYVKSQLKAGVDEIVVRQALLTNGWAQADVDQVINQAKMPTGDLPSKTDLYFKHLETPPQKKSKTWLWIVLAVVIVGIAVAAYLFFTSPQFVLAQALENTAKNKSFRYSLSLNTTISDVSNLPALTKAKVTETKRVAGVNTMQAQAQNPSQMEINAKLSGIIDTTDPQSYKQSADMNLSISAEDEMLGEISAKSMYLAKKFYFTVEQSPEDFMYDLSSVLGKWYVYDLSQYEEELTQTKENSSQDNIMDLISVLNQNGAIKLSKKSDPTYYKYEVSLEKENLLTGLNKYNEQLEEPYSQTELNSITEELKNIELPKIEIYITKAERQIKEVRILSQNILAEEVGGSMDLEVILTLDKWGETFNLSEPKDSKPVEEFVAAIMSDTMSMYNQTDTDGDGIPDLTEQVTGTDPTKADTDGDGYSDLDEIEGGYNPLGEGKLDESI